MTRLRPALTTERVSSDVPIFVRRKYVAASPEPQTLTYQICEIASPLNCDVADVALTVTPFPIDAVNDSGVAPLTGGTALASVLANDRFNNAAATLAKVRLTQVTSAHAGISLNVATGAVAVAAGTPVGAYVLRYRICETATPSNCDEADVAVTVQPLLIRAVNDTARGSNWSYSSGYFAVVPRDRPSCPREPQHGGRNLPWHGADNEAGQLLAHGG